MNTSTFIQHCRHQTTATLALANTEQFIEEDGSIDCESYDHHWYHHRNNIIGLIEECTNPTLPSFRIMIEHALKGEFISADDVESLLDRSKELDHHHLIHLK